MTARMTLEQLSVAFIELIELPRAKQEQWLLEEIPDPLDRDALYRMLRADQDESPGFLDREFVLHAENLASSDEQNVEPASLIGQVFGSFKLVRLVGQGGMATVFLGHRVAADFEQKVAVKLLRRGLFSTLEQQLFQRERRVLAQLNHPNIARLIDGGVSAAGISFLVMEYVEGLRIDHHAIANRLDVWARLSLFVETCRGVEAAHQSLVVHRDLKPSNILVTPEGRPKLLDFGIAKLLQDEASDSPYRTLTGAMTPGYAAPEQLLGEPITMAADVYALGILLHELLTGLRPSEHANRLASQLVPNDAELKSLRISMSASTLRKTLRGDLDNILSKAIDPEPKRRYGSASALLNDIQNYLNGQPVTAHPPSTWYQVRKLLLRHRLASALTLVFSASILLALGLFFWQARIARQEAHRATVVKEFLLSVFGTGNADLPRDERPTPDEVVSEAINKIVSDTTLPDVTKVELLLALTKVALGFGSQQQADVASAKLLQLAENQYPKFSPTWSAAMAFRCTALRINGRFDDAYNLLAPVANNMLENGSDEDFQALLSFVNAVVDSGAGQDESVSWVQKIHAKAQASATISANTKLTVLIGSANFFSNIHEFALAMQYGDQALAFWNANKLPLTREIFDLQSSIGNAASSLGDQNRGEAAYRKAIELSERFYARPHRDTAWFIGQLGSYLVSLRRVKEAEPYVLRGLEMRRNLLGDTHYETIFAFSAAARLRVSQKRNEEAFVFYREALKGCEKKALKHTACVNAMAGRARFYMTLKRYAEARVDIKNALLMATELSGADSPMLNFASAIQAEIERSDGNYELAIEIADRVIDRAEKAGGGHWQEVAMARLQRAWSKLELGRPQQDTDDILKADIAFRLNGENNVGTRLQIATINARIWAKNDAPELAKKAAQEAMEFYQVNQTDDAELLRGLQQLKSHGKGY